MKRTRLIAALDTQSLDQVRDWASVLDGHVDAIKLGMEFTYAQGFSALREVAGRNPLFLDLKLHDIPNTVAKGLSSLAPIGASLLTIHASGGAAMIAAARQAIDASYPPLHRPVLLAVTVLTSIDEPALREIGVPATPREQVIRLGRLAMTAGADGLVCSAEEIAPLRDALGDAPVLVVPGIRPAGTDANDQKRIMTPRQAAQAGADWIVVGRPITQAPDPATAAAAIQAELASA
ncbi:orotidine-5'-phosphate decarboxylase [Asaia bogorensis]|uniref:orotidine-5'-phosphate decarboxylase n=1 Tax=Asaia bogorensis TaxID=91915 RepID=UPI000EFB9BCC|nr:orotidine-5'-phosphate decarboxylase [Asaia bogorensis]